MRRKALAGIVVVAMTVSLLAGCGSKKEVTTGNNTQNTQATETVSDQKEEKASDNYLDKEPLRLATMPHQMGISLYYADRENLFEKAGINVELNMFSGGAAINEAIGAGEIDGAISGMASVYALSNGLVTMVGEVDTVGSDGIIVRKDSDILSSKGLIAGKEDMYGSAETLKGKSFICQVGQAQQFYIMKYVSQFGLSPDDVEYLNMEDAAGYEAFVNGEGDGISTKVPYLYTLITDDSNYVEIATNEQATDIQVKDCIIFTKDTVENRRDEVKIFLQVIYDAIDAMSKDENLRSEVERSFFNENGKSFDDDQLVYENSVNKLITSEYITSSDYCMGDGMKEVAQFYAENGSIPADLAEKITDNYDGSLLSETLGATVNVSN